MNDPLNIQIEGRGVDTSVPYLSEGSYPFQIVESAIAVNKKQTGHNWHMKLALTSPGSTPDGKPVNVNFPVFLDIALQPSDEAKDPEGFKRQIFAAQDAISGTDMSNRETFNMEYVKGAIGKNVMANIVIDEYPKGSGSFNNKVKSLKKAS